MVDLKSNFLTAGFLNKFSAVNDSKQNHDHGNDQENMDQATHGGPGHEPQHPQNDQHERDCV